MLYLPFNIALNLNNYVCLLHGLYSRKEGRRARRPETGD